MIITIIAIIILIALDLHTKSELDKQIIEDIKIVK
jgi:hypothetical protein